MQDRKFLTEKWATVLSHKDMPAIENRHKREVTAIALENTIKALQEERGYAANYLTEAAPVNSMGASSSTASSGNVDIFDPVLISLVRRAMPNLIAYDICGVQPMTGPTGLIFAMRSRYTNQTGAETFYNEVNTAFSGKVGGTNAIGDNHVGGVPTSNLETYNFGGAMSTTEAEGLDFAEMALSIEKIQVTAKTRALKAEYSMELAQDLKAVHGLDAEAELSNILASEILAEINREVVRTINVTAVAGAQEGVATAGVFDLDVDSNGRWAVEKFKGLTFQIEREANQIAKQTRRGKGNILICSSDVASALQMAGVLDFAPAMNATQLEVDDTGNTFAGVLNGRMRVYIDPYATGQYITVGYKGNSPFDAGLFYCPYVPLQMARAVDPTTFQPKIAFKTRYGMVANPFAEGLNAGNGQLKENTNVYYRRLRVQNLL